LPSALEIKGKEFKIYEKRQKTNPAEESLQDENVHSTIVLTGP